jgi:hypothetical protein
MSAARRETLGLLRERQAKENCRNGERALSATAGKRIESPAV